VGGTSDDERAAEFLSYLALKLLLDAVELHRWQKLSVGKLGQVFGTAAHPDEGLYVVIPRRQVVVANRPVDCNAVARIRLKIHLAPAVALTAPGDRTTADLIASYPVEPLLLDVGIIQLVDKPMFGCL